MTFTEIRHQGAGHNGTAAQCAKCQATDPNRPEVNRKAKAAAARRTAAVKRHTR